jgi:xylitol oxidase
LTTTTTNWAGSITYSAHTLHAPSSVDQLQEIVRAAPKVRVLGSRHTFNAIADSAELITLSGLPQDIQIDRATRTASVPAGITYGALAQALDSAGLALHNLASLPHVSLAGAVATGTHGSGDRNANLSSAVAGFEMVTSTGECIRAIRGEPDFDGMVVNLAALGAVTRYTLDVQPTYDVRQTVYQDLDWQTLLDNFDAVTARGDSVSVFTSWGDTLEQVWVKTRVSADGPLDEPTLFGAPAATVDLHPLPGMDPRNCTPQRGQPGAWWTRLTHFCVDFQPSTGDELQSEYMVPRALAVDAINAVRGLADRIRPLLYMSEIRTVAADTLWMSPMYGRDTVCLHFTWRRRQLEVEAVLADLELALQRFEARPHWGKLFLADSARLGPLYPRRADFLRLVERLDPRGAFGNDWFAKHVRGK